MGLQDAVVMLAAMILEGIRIGELLEAVELRGGVKRDVYVTWYQDLDEAWAAYRYQPSHRHLCHSDGTSDRNSY